MGNTLEYNKGEFVIKPAFHDPGVFFDGLAKVGNLTGSGVGSSRYFYINKRLVSTSGCKLLEWLSAADSKITFNSG